MNEIIVFLLNGNDSLSSAQSKIKQLIKTSKTIVVISITDRNGLINTSGSLIQSQFFFEGPYEKCVEYLLQKNKKIIEVISFKEQYIEIAFALKSDLGFELSKYNEMFKNKTLQRELFGKSKLLKIKKMEYMVEEIINIHAQDVDRIIGFPCILKPVWGASSLNVYKIESVDDFNDRKEDIIEHITEKKGFTYDKILIEEYLHGQMMSIDYYVDESGNISYSYPIFQYTSNDYYGNNDFSILRQRIGEFIEDIISLDDLKLFIEETVSVCGIRNTFVHHEIKYNLEHKFFKTIEINGRIGGHRLSIYDHILGLNLFELIYTKRDLHYQGQLEGSIVKLYPPFIRGEIAQFSENFLSVMQQGKKFIYKKLYGKLGRSVGPIRCQGGRFGFIECKYNRKDKDHYEKFEKKVLEFISSDQIEPMVKNIQYPSQ